MIDFLKKYFILIFLGFLVVVLILLKIFYSNNEIKENNSISLTPTETPTETIGDNLVLTPTAAEQYVNDDPKEDDTIVLPYKGKKIEITGYSKIGVLEVLIEKEEDKLEAEIEFKEWQKQYPILKTDIFEFKISKLD